MFLPCVAVVDVLCRRMSFGGLHAWKQKRGMPDMLQCRRDAQNDRSHFAVGRTRTLRDIHSCDKNKWAPFAEIAGILDFNDIWPSYRKADGSDARQTCIIADAENDSATVYLRNTAASSFKNTEAIWVIYESSRIILLVSGGLASEPSECQVSDEMENDDDWTPMSPNCKVVVANVKGRPIFLSDGYKLLRLE